MQEAPTPPTHSYTHTHPSFAVKTPQQLCFLDQLWLKPNEESGWTPNHANATYTRSQVLVDEPLEFENNYSWPIDPLWMESDWPSSSPSVRIYQQEPYSVQVCMWYGLHTSEVGQQVMRVACRLPGW